MPHILVVDDDAAVCAALELCLQRHGFQVTVANSTEAGLRALEDSASAFDAMLIDVFIPNMLGFRSLQRFYERLPEIPLIAMSGFDFPSADFLELTLGLSATRYLRKPFSPAALFAATDECVAGSPAMTRLAG